MKTRLVAIDELNNTIYQNLAQSYEAEFAPLTGELPTEQGLYTLQTPVVGPENIKNAWGYLYYENKIPVGFAVISKINGIFDVAEFYILPSFRKKKYGTKLAHEVIRKFPGHWQVRQIEGADHAVKFWRSAITEIVGEKELDEKKVIDPSWGRITRQSFVYKGHNL